MSQITVEDIYHFLNNLAPLSLAEKKDSNGLQIGSLKEKVTGILLAVNPILSVFEEANLKGCNLIITHHPLFYHPLPFIDKEGYPGKIIYYAIKNELNLLSWHTPLDKVSYGVSEALLQALSKAFELEIEDFLYSEGEGVGYGKVAKLKNCVKLGDLAKRIKEILNSWVMIVGNPEREIERIALCGGAGAFLYDQLKIKGIDTFITSDVKYHQALTALEEGFNFILIDHGLGEAFVLDFLKRRLEDFLREKGSFLPIYIYQEKSPYQVI